jgi:hypothetical protein
VIRNFNANGFSSLYPKYKGGLCWARTHKIALRCCYLCLSGCSPVLADQAVNDLSVRDPAGHIDRLAGLV